MAAPARVLPCPAHGVVGRGRSIACCCVARRAGRAAREAQSSERDADVRSMLTPLAMLAALMAAGSTTEPARSCTRTWTGAASGAWTQADNWSGAAVPGPRDRACVPARVEVRLGGEAQRVGSVQVQGTLRLEGGSLEVTGSTGPRR